MKNKYPNLRIDKVSSQYLRCLELSELIVKDYEDDLELIIDSSDDLQAANDHFHIVSRKEYYLPVSIRSGCYITESTLNITDPEKLEFRIQWIRDYVLEQVKGSCALHFMSDEQYIEWKKNQSSNNPTKEN